MQKGHDSAKYALELGHRCIVQKLWKSVENIFIKYRPCYNETQGTPVIG